MYKRQVLIDLKTERITHQDVGQMDMYIRMYDELKKAPDDNPTLGIVLCSETDEDIARYSISVSYTHLDVYKRQKEQSDLQPIVDAYKEYKACKQTIEDSLAILDEESCLLYTS